MTDWTPQTNRVRTDMLTDVEKPLLQAAIKANGGEFFRNRSDGPVWIAKTGSDDYLFPDEIYRAKPAPVTQDVVPWEAMCAEITFAARDMGGQTYGFCGKPSVQGCSWGSAQAATRIDNVFAGYTPGTCDWRDSLQQRPQPAATGAVTGAVTDGARYWLASPDTEKWSDANYWADDDLDRLWLSRGLIHLTEASAVAHAKRMTGGV